MDEITILGIMGSLRQDSYDRSALKAAQERVPVGAARIQATHSGCRDGETPECATDAQGVFLLEQDVSTLRADLKSMTHEHTYLKKIATAAALLVAGLDRVSLHGGTATAAVTLARLIEGMSEGQRQR